MLRDASAEALMRSALLVRRQVPRCVVFVAEVVAQPLPQPLWIDAKGSRKVDGALRRSLHQTRKV